MIFLIVLAVLIGVSLVGLALAPLMSTIQELGAFLARETAASPSLTASAGTKEDDQ